VGGNVEGTSIRISKLIPLKSDEIEVYSEKDIFNAVLRFADQFKDDRKKRDSVLEKVHQE
jgi:hypothetical protein